MQTLPRLAPSPPPFFSQKRPSKRITESCTLCIGIELRNSSTLTKPFLWLRELRELPLLSSLLLSLIRPNQTKPGSCRFFISLSLFSSHACNLSLIARFLHKFYPFFSLGVHPWFCNSTTFSVVLKLPVRYPPSCLFIHGLKKVEKKIPWIINFLIN